MVQLILGNFKTNGNSLIYCEIFFEYYLNSSSC